MSERTFYLPSSENPHHSPEGTRTPIAVEVKELTRAELAVGEACQVSESDATAASLVEDGRIFERVNVFRHVAGADDWIEVWRRVV